MEVGQVRSARKGEIPHFYSLDAIEANQGVVDTMRRIAEENIRQRIVPPIIDDEYGTLMDDWNRADRKQLIVEVRNKIKIEQAKTARGTVWSFVVVLVIGAVLVLLEFIPVK